MTPRRTGAIGIALLKTMNGRTIYQQKGPSGLVFYTIGPEGKRKFRSLITAVRIAMKGK